MQHLSSAIHAIAQEFHQPGLIDLSALFLHSINTPKFERKRAIFAGLTNLPSCGRVKITTKMQVKADIETKILSLAKEAKQAASILAQAGTQQKNHAISIMAEKLAVKKAEVIEANQEDQNWARQSGLSSVLLQRLVFDERKIGSRIEALLGISLLPDPIGCAAEVLKRPSGLEVKRVRVPIGVIGMIYESRPHVTVNAGALCLKSGNAVLLKGGSETIRTNTSLGRLWQEALGEAGLPTACIQVIETTERAAVATMLSLDQFIDVLIPRGGKGLIEMIRENSKIPIIKHYHGICHVFIDREVQDDDVAIGIALDSKILMPEVCNAMETLLIDEEAALRLLPKLAEQMRSRGVQLRGCPRTRQLVPWVEEAKEEDWWTEYLDLILSIKVVSSVDEAISHINHYGSHHTDAIVSENFTNIKRFEGEVDSAVVLVNASTMFNDGAELGLGAEIGISTDKLHARGPVGLRDLTSYKYVVIGSGNIMGAGS
jgi:glutamate-5-semialdehyde dehydrogenase